MKLTEKELNKRARQLEEGTVWESASGTQYKVLAVANAHVPAKVQAKYPLTVVFVNMDNIVFAKLADDFLSQYTFVDSDTNLCNALDILYQANSGETVPSLDEMREAFSNGDDTDDYDSEDMDSDEDDDIPVDESEEEIEDVEIEDEEDDGVEDAEIIREEMKVPEPEVASVEKLSYPKALDVSYVFEGSDSPRLEAKFLADHLVSYSLLGGAFARFNFKASTQDSIPAVFKRSHVNKLTTAFSLDGQKHGEILTWGSIASSGFEVTDTKNVIQYIIVGNISVSEVKEPAPEVVPEVIPQVTPEVIPVVDTSPEVPQPTTSL